MRRNSEEVGSRTCRMMLVLKRCENVLCLPLYRARGPSVVMVFHRQSMGFLYRVPTVVPFGSCIVGWLYILVRAYCGQFGDGFMRFQPTVSAGCIITNYFHRQRQLQTQKYHAPHTRLRRSYSQDTSIYCLQGEYFQTPAGFWSSYKWAVVPKEITCQ